MLKHGLLFLAAVATGITGAVAQQDSLQPLSRLELERAFGTTRAIAPPEQIDPRLADTLRGGDALESLHELGRRANAGSVNSNVLLELLRPESPGRGEPALRYLLLWHQIALDVTAIDHAPTRPGELHQQFGPARAARALALVHQAMYEAALAFSNNKYRTTLNELPSLDSGDASVEAAITEAAYQTLAWLYPRLNETAIHAQLPPGGSVTLEASGAPRISDTTCPMRMIFSLRNYYLCALATIADDDSREKGAKVGRVIAGEVRRVRASDRSDLVEPELERDFNARFPESVPFRAFEQWQRDPVSKLSIALGGNWDEVKPFALASPYEFRPSEDSAPRVVFSNPTDKAQIIRDVRSLKSYNAIEKWGGDSRLMKSGLVDQAQDSGDGFFLAQLWAYDGTAYLCAPPRLYNQIATTVLREIRRLRDANDPAVSDRAAIDADRAVDVGRYLALVNFAMADAAIAAWDAKYYFQFPRPVTYIRSVWQLQDDLGERPPAAPMVSVPSAPSGDAPAGQQGEGEVSQEPPAEPAVVQNAALRAEDQPNVKLGAGSKKLWFPVGAQVTNSDNPVNITPPFPAYVSGHAAFGGAVFGMLRQFVSPRTEFTFLSDEFNGRNKDAFNYIRCERDGAGNLVDMHTPAKFCSERSFTADCAERENADSRLWMGVHWIHDADDGITMGNQVARKVYSNMMQPRFGGMQRSFFSVRAEDYSGNLRTALACSDLDLPDGWDSPDGEIGFGELVLKEVAATE